jgi:hypothetical protein
MEKSAAGQPPLVSDRVDEYGVLNGGDLQGPPSTLEL